VESDTTAFESAAFVDAVVLAGTAVPAPGTVDPFAATVVDESLATVVAEPADVDEPPATVVDVPSASDVVGPETATEVDGPEVAGPDVAETEVAGPLVAGPDVGVCELVGVGTVVTVDGAGAADDAGAAATELAGASEGDGEPPVVAFASAGVAAAHASATIDEIVRTVLRAMVRKIGGFSTEVRQDAV
jgi:hypothetical protein